ncbi:MAG: hypothetical protein NT020_14410 [Chloroflexales bacterium]|nr:hypothetical protein [Chloroflexales bacterium]
MNDTVFYFWNELSAAAQRAALATLGDLPAWMQYARTRTSTIVVALQHELPVAALVTLHDRLAIGAAVVDVAVVRHVSQIPGIPNDVIVQMLMHQSMMFIEEGLGLVLVYGDAAEWSRYGFAPVSHRVRVAWGDSHARLAVMPGGTLAIPTDNERRIIQSMALTDRKVAIRFVDWAAWPQRPWVLVYGNDGQLTAAADFVTKNAETTVVYAVASNDGAASDLVLQLLHSGLVTRPITFQLPFSHALTQMALYHQGVVQVVSAGKQALLLGVLDLPMMLIALIPAFEQRLLASPYANWNGGVRIEISDERAMIMVQNGKVSVIDGTREADVRIKQVELIALAQMTFGYRSISGLRRAGLLMCDDTELPLCEILFPSLYPNLTLD